MKGLKTHSSKLLFGALISGAAVGFSYIPFPPVFLFAALTPVWYGWLKDPRPRAVFFRGWLMQCVLTLIGFHWVAHTAVAFGHLPWPLGILTLVLFAAFANIHFALAGLTWSMLNKWKKLPPLFSLLIMALLTHAFESLWPKIFPWNFGYPWLWAGLPGFQFADIVGFEGLSALTLLINAFILFAFLNRRKGAKAAAISAGIAVFFILFNLAGFFYTKTIDPGKTNPLKILMVQSNIGNWEKYRMKNGQGHMRERILEKYQRLTRAGLDIYGDTELTVWPENALPLLFDPIYNDRRPFNRKALDVIRKLGTSFYTGAYSGDPHTRKMYTAGFLYDEKGNYVDVYRKSILLAFGEYIPGADIFPFIKKLLPMIGTFDKGEGPKMIKAIYPAGPQICYEGLFPLHSKVLVDKGAAYFLNITNDSWYGHTIEHHQHLTQTRARAVEFRRPMVRVANTGISAAIDIKGTLRVVSPVETEWVRQVTLDVPETPRATVYQRVAPFVRFAALFLTVCLMVFHLRQDTTISYDAIGQY